jgi:hypothetical protein
VDDATARALARFWPKVNKTESCWLWTASKMTGGYGSFSWSTHRSTAHRFAYETFVGPIPEGIEVDHLCFHRDCVNPEHLALVTKAQNQQNRAGASIASTTGYRGVFREGNKWVARVQVNGKLHGLSGFTSPEEANVAAIALRNELMTHNRVDRRASA